MGFHFASLIVHTADTSRVLRGRPPATGGPETDYGTAVHVDEVLMLRTPEDHEHSDVFLCLREAFSLDVFDPCEVGKVNSPTNTTRNIKHSQGQWSRRSDPRMQAQSRTQKPAHGNPNNKKPATNQQKYYTCARSMKTFAESSAWSNPPKYPVPEQS